MRYAYERGYFSAFLVLLPAFIFRHSQAHLQIPPAGARQVGHSAALASGHPNSPHRLYPLLFLLLSNSPPLTSNVRVVYCDVSVLP